jgi:hypothetical protein
MNDSVYFMRQVTEFITNNPNHPTVIDYQKGNIGLGYIVRNWKEINNEDNPNQWEGSSRENNGCKNT